MFLKVQSSVTQSMLQATLAWWDVAEQKHTRNTAFVFLPPGDLQSTQYIQGPDKFCNELAVSTLLFSVSELSWAPCFCLLIFLDHMGVWYFSGNKLWEMPAYNQLSWNMTVRWTKICLNAWTLSCVISEVSFKASMMCPFPLVILSVTQSIAERHSQAAFFQGLILVHQGSANP